MRCSTYWLASSVNMHDINSFCLEHARVIFCTASSSSNLNQSKAIDLLVIDEDAQLKESESFIPLQLPWVRHAILIGDERQLPAMIKSKISEKCGFGRSLFERLVTLGHMNHLLNVQYRMHPSISVFPNTEFYGKQICDASSVKDESYKRNLLHGSMYSSYSFINVSYGMEELDDGHSLRNMAEVYVISEIVQKLYQGAKNKESDKIIRLLPHELQLQAHHEGNGNGGGVNGVVAHHKGDGNEGGANEVVAHYEGDGNEGAADGLIRIPLV